MTLRPLELALVTREIASALHRQPLQRVIEYDARTLLLGFPRRWLLICVAARTGRLHLVDERPPGRGREASPFCMLMRKLLVGARLESALSIEGERAAVLTFARSDGRRRLHVFLYGAAAHVSLVDEEGRSLGRMGGARTASELPAPRLVPEAPPSRFAGPEPSRGIAAHYQAAEAEQRREARRTQARAEAHRQLARLRRLARNLEEDLRRTQRAADLRRDADLIFAHLREIPRGASEVTLPDDFAEGKPRQIALDPARSARDHATRLYHQHKRLTRGRAALQARLDESRRAAAALEAKLAGLEDGAALPADEPPATAPPRRRQRSRLPYLVYFAANGDEIWVGRSTRDNDALTFRCAHGDDLWLHARDFSGSHVVVPQRQQGPVSEATLLDAATLAAHHSAGRGESRLDVTYAPRKYVRKLSRGTPGEVSIAGGKTLHLRLETARLARLLASHPREQS